MTIDSRIQPAHDASRKLSVSKCETIDRICLHFEDEWLANARPDIADCLKQAAGETERFRQTLARELLLLDLTYRKRKGQSPELTTYAALLPEFQPLVMYLLARAAEPEPCELECGQQIGRYTIERKLGQGGFGTAYLAYDKELTRHVAIKVSHRLPSIPADPLQESLREMPSNEDTSSPAGGTIPVRSAVAAASSSNEVSPGAEEARIAASLSCPHIVQIYDIGHLEDGTSYTVMQFIEGGTLRQRLAEGSMSFGDIARCFRQIAEALAVAHETGLVHRDLDPDNILLDDKDYVYVADFGLAIRESRQAEAAGEFAGSLPYMAPEQIRGEAHRLDGRADIWALGIILYEALTGRPPFQGDHPDQLMDEILYRDPKPPRQIQPAIPAEFEQICLRCLAKSPTERFSTAVDVATEFQKWDAKQNSHFSRRMWLFATTGVAAAGLGFWQIARTRPVAADSNALHARIDLIAWDHRRMMLGEPGVVPVHAGDRLKLQVRASQSVYMWLVWLDAQGRAALIYPSDENSWKDFAIYSPRVESIDLPSDDPEAYWKAQVEQRGVESVVLLTRREWPADPLRLQRLVEQGFQNLPTVEEHAPATAAWFENGRYQHYRWQPRGYDRSPPQPIQNAELRDSLFRLHREIYRRLGDEFSLIQSVSFGVEAEARSRQLDTST